MSKKLSGSSSLDIKNAPTPKEDEKLGLIQKPKNGLKTYRLSAEAIDSLECIARRLSTEAKTKFSMAKVLEIAIFYISDKSLKDLLP